MKIPRTRDFLEILPTTIAKAELRPGERLIWADRPTRGSIFRETARGALTGLGFSAFAAFWSGAAYVLAGSAGPPFSFMPYIGLLFFAFGLMMVIGALQRFRVLRSQLYVLSRERFLVVSDRPAYRVHSHDLASITGVGRQVRRGGSGTLTLTLGGGHRAKFAGVPEIERVATEIERMRRKTGD